MRTLLYKLSPSEPSVLAATMLALVLLVVVSALTPAGRAASVSTTSVLRE
jgi:ABC-type lipoprotein release transport system permease subunit